MATPFILSEHDAGAFRTETGDDYRWSAEGASGPGYHLQPTPRSKVAPAVPHGQHSETTSARPEQALVVFSPPAEATLPSPRRLELSALEVAQRAHEQALSGVSQATPPRKRKKWSDEEVAKLREGVQKHGHGYWAEIYADKPFHGRTPTDLCNKWRNVLRSDQAEAAPRVELYR